MAEYFEVWCDIQAHNISHSNDYKAVDTELFNFEYSQVCTCPDIVIYNAFLLCMRKMVPFLIYSFQFNRVLGNYVQRGLDLCPSVLEDYSTKSEQSGIEHNMLRKLARKRLSFKRQIRLRASGKRI